MKSDKNLRTITYYAKGMHCAACEILLEKELSRLSTVISVKASLYNNQLEVGYQYAKPDLDLINRRISPHGYFLSEVPVEDNNKFISYNSRTGLRINNNNLFNLIYAFVFSILILFVFRYLSGNAFGSFNISKTST